MLPNTKNGFTLIELLVVIAIIGLLAGSISATIYGAFDSSRGSKTGQIKKVLNQAAQLYQFDMGFYPPDVNRGWDPGFERPVPWNHDLEEGNPVPGWASTPGTDCGHCPADWEDIVAVSWNGPYVEWPVRTPWGGLYDYNYWESQVTRPQGCAVEAGIYAGAQAYYNDTSGDTSVPPEVEVDLIEIGIDDDGCVNGESQLLLFKL